MATVGPTAVADLHHRAAIASALDWRVAAYHFRKAGDYAAVASTIAGAIPEIMGGGQHAAAIEEIDRVPETMRPPVLDLVVSRIELQRRDYASAIELSRAVLEIGRTGLPRERLRAAEPGHSVPGIRRSPDDAREMARRLGAQRRVTINFARSRVARDLMIDASGSGSLAASSRHLRIDGGSSNVASTPTTSA